VKKAYFPASPGNPLPLRMTVSRRVRFEEVDSLGIVWHGHYSSYFDDARTTLGDAYSMGYLDFLDNRVVTPIRKLHIDYLKPLSYPETASIEALLHFSEAARIDYEVIVRGGEGDIRATGYSVQMILDEERRPLIVPPPFLVAVREKWKRGELVANINPDTPPAMLTDRVRIP
jgi:acyl-CoA thioester hydrolase